MVCGSIIDGIFGIVIVGTNSEIVRGKKK